MKLTLGVKERLLVLGLLPERGNIADLRILREMETLLGFSAEEHEQLKIRQMGPGVTTWNEKVAETMARSFEFPDRVIEIVKERLQQLSQDNQLHKDHLAIWNMFVGE